jgi:hypothetical protein
MSDEDTRRSARLPPDEAFGALGNETRIAALRTLGEGETPMSFSTLYDQVPADDTGGFSYHLDRLVGHFVTRSDEGYSLTRAGRRVVEAVLSGAVTETPDLPLTGVDATCERCGGDVLVRWREGSVERFCTDCSGRYDRSYRGDDGTPVRDGYLGRYPLPPAGLRDRDADGTLRAAWTWGNLELLALSNGLCPRCSAPVERELSVCEDHESGPDEDADPCAACGRQDGTLVHAECTNCIYVVGGNALAAVTGHAAVLDFLTDHGYDPVAPSAVGEVEAVHEPEEETVRGTDPLVVDLTLTADGERLSLRVDEELTVLDVSRADCD